ncbi:TlpA disulfide reductase family protein [Streptomyces sp. NPDC046203]|uniref:TlpA family protein disulfide reductase n=1 Tax=Streptomyces sp. NPDC046203 TaxID=3154602 RepID=UPI0034015A20
MSLSRAPRRALTAAVFLAAALALTACSSDSNGKSGGGGGTNFVTSSGGISTVAKGERTATGKLAGKTLEGKQLDVADLKGKVVVLNVWGSWCAPCRGEAPHFAKAAKELKSKGADVEFVGINTRDGATSKGIAFDEEFGIPYPSLFDPYGKIILEGFPKGTLNPQGIPTTIILDKEGKIAARSLMGLDETKLRSMIDPLLAEK